MENQPVVDAHHHLWDLKENRYPWLSPDRGPDPFPDFERLCHDYLLEDFMADVSRQHVVKSVHVQAEHDEADPVRETAWLQRVADRPGSGGFPHGIVAWADLSDPGVEAVLEGHRAYPNVRGIRQMLNYTPPTPGQPAPAFGHHGDLLANEGFQRRFGLLRKYDLSFDLQIFPWQTEAGAALVAAHPDTVFVLNHTIMPFDRSEAGLAVWRHAAETYAALPNVSIKISGLGMAPGGFEPGMAERLVRETIEVFGPSRCLFASNFPVDKLMADYDTIWGLFRRSIATYSEAEQEAMLRGNAERVYRL
ncbi:MAG: amidohydrolase family protein [Spirochaetaceae bacterium]|nr:amidohydrolase family protein [Myxococcales bacterium]MCB9726186.1 amidohydrolase family protein [Spirochaetaceae bacterium]HPG24603.1 amidohydrolase family protein [Myxococcota bacterium]